MVKYWEDTFILSVLSVLLVCLYKMVPDFTYGIKCPMSGVLIALSYRVRF